MNLKVINVSSKKMAVAPAAPIRMALLNVRSLANKTFLLNDLFTSRELDFMLLTETWLRIGDSTPFSELLPPNCSFFICVVCGGVPSTPIQQRFYARVR